MLLLSECRQASERQELAFACTLCTGAFLALALAWNIGHQWSHHLVPATLRCRAVPATLVRSEWEIGFVASTESWAVPLVADRVWKASVERTTVAADELGSGPVAYDYTGQSDYPRNVVNLKQTMDAPSGDFSVSFVGSACGGTLLERRRRNWMTSRGPSFSMSWTGERLDVTARELLSLAMGVASRSGSALPLSEVTLERGAELVRELFVGTTNRPRSRC